MYMELDIWWKENKGDVFLDIPDAGEQEKRIISYKKSHKKRLLFWEKDQCSNCFCVCLRGAVQGGFIFMIYMFLYILLPNST